MTLNIKVVPDEKIKKFLMEKYQIPDYQADVCVAFAQGNVGKAIQLASSDDFNEMKASALQLIKVTSCPTGIECSFEQCSGKYFPT